jgi:DNA-directed RNA polymerase sigma subunit (sigma70/sigma32)
MNTNYNIEESLTELAAAELSLREARHDLEVWIVASREAGASLRDIAEVAGVSHETVRRITDRWC